MTDNDKPSDSDSAASAADQNADDPKSLDDLLASWKEGATDDKPAAKKPDSDALLQHVANLSYKLEMKDVIPTVKGELPVTDKFVENYINMRATENAKLSELWDNRDSRRAEFDEAVKAMTGEFADFAKENGIGKPKVTDADDDKGLAAAAHMARSTQAADTGLDSVNWSGLSDTDFALRKQEVIRMAESGKLK